MQMGNRFQFLSLVVFVDTRCCARALHKVAAAMLRLGEGLGGQVVTAVRSGLRRLTSQWPSGTLRVRIISHVLCECSPGKGRLSKNHEPAEPNVVKEKQ